MAQVQTVQGPVDAGELGLVLVHEHVRFRDEAVADAVARSATTSSSSSTRRSMAVQRGQGARRADDRRPDGDVRRARRALHEARRRRDGRADRRLHRHLQLRLPAPLLREPRRRRDGRPLRRGHRKRLPGHRDQGGVPEVRRRRGRRDRARREDPPRVRAREPADGRADHGPLDARRRHRPAPGRDLPGGGRRPGARPDRPLRRHRRRRLHRGPDRQGRVRRASTATASRCTCRSTSATRRPPSCCAAGTPSG